MKTATQEGFITITFLGLLPLLMTVAVAWMAAETSITQYAKVQHVCRVHALKMQEITLRASTAARSIRGHRQVDRCVTGRSISRWFFRSASKSKSSSRRLRNQTDRPSCHD